MCFHSKQSKDAQTLQNRFNAKIERPELFTTGDINGFEHPYCAIITNDRQEIIQMAQWGLLPDWAKDKQLQNSTLNARFESISEKPAFRNSVSKYCLILCPFGYKSCRSLLGFAIPTYNNIRIFNPKYIQYKYLFLNYLAD